jgi:hypothetical protein
MRKSLVALGLIATTLATGAASAEPFGAHGTVAIGAERLFGLEYTSQTNTPPGGTEQKSSVTSVSLFGHTALLEDMGNLVSAMPRLSADVFLGPGVSVGGALMYQSMNVDHPASGPNDSSDKIGLNLLLFAPRVGFGARITDTFAIWPRLGITYLHSWTSQSSMSAGVEDKSRGTGNNMFLTLDAMMVVSPVQHAAFTFGPTFDYLLSQSSTRDGVGVATGDIGMYSLGLQAGILLWF